MLTLRCTFRYRVPRLRLDFLYKKMKKNCFGKIDKSDEKSSLFENESNMPICCFSVSA